ncbi:MAG: ABC transporter permease [Acidimicrobiales bacterium]
MTTPDTSGAKTVLENSADDVGLSSRLGDIWRYRELLVNLTMREIKVKYKNSVLGIVWTFLNPLLYLAVFSLVFGVILPSGAPRYGLLLLSGLQAWNLFSMGMTAATTSITGNATLVQKVWFPREILPLSAVGASFVTFWFQMIVLLIGLSAFRQAPAWDLLPLLIPALLVALLLGTGLGLLLSAVNVYFRDVQHFLELGVLTWFWFTPIVYQYDFVARAVTDRWGLGAERLTLLNPMIPVVTTFQRVLYNPENFDPQVQTDTFGFLMHDGWWFLQNLVIEIGVGLVVLMLGFRVFRRLEANFGEEL